MIPTFCMIIFHVFILALTLLALGADREDECYVRITVPRNTKYIALLGKNLRIECPVKFCSDPPLTVSWLKLEETYVPVNVSHGSRFRTEWKTVKHLEGVFVLRIQNFVRNDSGVYQCRSGSSVGHKIYVSVNETVKSTTLTWTTIEPRSPETEEHLWPTVYRVVGVMGLVIIVIIAYLTSNFIRKCVRGRSKDPSSQPSTKAEPMDNDYEDVQ